MLADNTDELDIAVKEENLEKVKALLSLGANVYFRVDEDGSTLLHRTRSLEIARALLSHGASVNVRNRYSETPLHEAVKYGKGLEFVKELLKHGADVNVTSRKRETPLHKAVHKYEKNFEIIKELLKYGADINIRNCVGYPVEKHATPLDKVLHTLGWAQLLIKFTVIRNFHKKKIIDLDPYKNHWNYNNLLNYVEDCTCEIVRMKTDMVNDEVSLYDFMFKNDSNTIALYASNEVVSHISHQVSVITTGTNYSIYQDILSDKIKLGLERGKFLDKLGEFQFYTELHVPNGDIEGKKIILDTDSTCNIAKYLSTDDLLSLIKVFCHFDHYTSQASGPSNNLVNLIQQADSKIDGPSTSYCSKRARLE